LKRKGDTRKGVTVMDEIECYQRKEQRRKKISYFGKEKSSNQNFSAVQLG
jgi:hypothetical protein